MHVNKDILQVWNVSYSLVIVAYVDMTNKRNVFLVDTNGVKGPNTLGRDIFSFKLEVDPDGKKDYIFGPEFETGEDNDACSATGNGGEAGLKGLGCGDRLLKEGKMSY